MKEPTERQTGRQAEIVDAAFTLIANNGVQEFTIKNLSSAIGVSEPALYRHFASKRDVLEGIVDRLVEIRNETWQYSQAEKSSSLAALQVFFTHQAHRFQEFPPLAIILFPEDIFRNDVELLNRIHVVMQETAQDIQKLIMGAQKQGSVRKEIDSSTVALLVTGGFRALVSGWRTEQQKDPSVELVKKVELFLKNTIQILG